MDFSPKYNWLQHSKTSNNWKTFFLLLLFPSILYLISYWITYWIFNNPKAVEERRLNIIKEFNGESGETKIKELKEKNNLIQSLTINEEGELSDPAYLSLIENFNSVDNPNYKHLILANKLFVFQEEFEKKYQNILKNPSEIATIYWDVKVKGELLFYFSLYFFWIFFWITIIRLIISFLFQKQLFFYYSGAKPLERKENPIIYNIVENLCISKWLPIPNIWIIDEPWLNAFAIGWKAEKSWIVFTKGLIDTLTKEEIEAVAAHELTHIINKDTLINVLVILWIGIISTLGYFFLRIWINSKRWNSKDSWNWKLVMIIGWLALLGISWLIFPLIRLAISRKREYLADAGSAELTKNPDALISALKKISLFPNVNNSSEDNMASMYIFEPKDKWLSSHPSLENRIAALKSYTV